jgi:hypothetical protein
MKTIRTLAPVVLMALAGTFQHGWAQEDSKAGGGGGASYVSGGVGTEQREALAARRGEFNLYITFARSGSGDLLADVALAITDLKGKPVMSAEHVGPLVYVKLPPGTYWVNATANGQQQSRNVTIGAGGREVTFHWTPGDQASVR